MRYKSTLLLYTDPHDRFISLYTGETSLSRFLSIVIANEVDKWLLSDKTLKVSNRGWNNCIFYIQERLTLLSDFKLGRTCTFVTRRLIDIFYQYYECRLYASNRFLKPSLRDDDFFNFILLRLSLILFSFILVLFSFV